MANKIRFFTDDEKEQAEAFVQLTELGEITCLVNNMYGVSDETLLLLLATKSEFPEFEIITRTVSNLIRRSKVGRNINANEERLIAAAEKEILDDKDAMVDYDSISDKTPAEKTADELREE